MKILVVFAVIILQSHRAFSGVSRIENFNVDRKKVNVLYLSYSRVNKIRFPDEVEEVLIGLRDLYGEEVSKKNKRDLNIRLKKGVTSSTNMIVTTTNQDIYVFDLFPRKTVHQDVIYIDDSFYKTRSKKSPVQKRKIYSHVPSKRVVLTTSKRVLIYSHRPDEEEKKK